MNRVTHMGWLRLVGSLKIWVSFAEYCLFYRAFLQKRPLILRSLLIEATPYVWHDSFIWVTRLIHMDTGVCWWTRAYQTLSVNKLNRNVWITIYIHIDLYIYTQIGYIYIYIDTIGMHIHTYRLFWKTSVTRMYE